MKKLRKFLGLLMISLILFSYFIPITNVFAAAAANELSVSFRENSIGHGKVQYSLGDGAAWVDVTENLANQSIEVSGDNLKLKIVPNENYAVDYTGIELNLDGVVTTSELSGYGFESDNGYTVPSDVQSVQLTNVEFKEDEGGQPGEDPVYDETAHVNVEVNGTEIENPYGDDASEIRVSVNRGGFVSLDKNNVTYTYETVDNVQKISSVTTNSPMDIRYQKVQDETSVVIGIRAQWNTFLTDVTINGVSYADSLPKDKNDLIASYENQELKMYFEVPKTENNTYSVVIEGRKQNENEIIMGNFLWDYNEQGYTAQEDKIFHSTLQFIKAEYGDTVYDSVEKLNAEGGLYAWHNVERKAEYTEEWEGVGSATFPVGTKLTVAIIPDSGYQLVSFGVNNGGFEPQDEIGVYTFEIKGGNFHLQAHVTDVANEVVSGSVNVANGNIDVDIANDTSFAMGTAKLEVNDIRSLSPERIENFENTAENGGYEIDNYLDISLYNSVYKGGKVDTDNNLLSWDTKVDNLNEEASITLELNQDMSGKEIAVVHETHNDDEVTGYEIIPAVYDEENKTIAFETDSFSNFAIISKESSDQSDDEPEKNKNYEVKDKNGNSIIFTEENGHKYSLNIASYLNMSDDDLSSLNISREEYNGLLNGIISVTKKDGDLLAVYEIMVEDENGNLIHEGPFNIKLKLTEEMKKYDVFKIVYIDLDNGFLTEEPIPLKVEGDYLVGTLNHLSVYAILGNKASDDSDKDDDNTEKPDSGDDSDKDDNNTKNPSTGDDNNINTYLGILFVSVFVLCIVLTLRICLSNKHRKY